MLWSSIVGATSVSNDVLEQQLKGQYATFLTTHPVAVEGICPAVRFVQSLLSSEDDNLGRKLAMLIGGALRKSYFGAKLGLIEFRGGIIHDIFVGYQVFTDG